MGGEVRCINKCRGNPAGHADVLGGLGRLARRAYWTMRPAHGNALQRTNPPDHRRGGGGADVEESSPLVLLRQYPSSSAFFAQKAPVVRPPGEQASTAVRHVVPPLDLGAGPSFGTDETRVASRRPLLPQRADGSSDRFFEWRPLLPSLTTLRSRCIWPAGSGRPASPSTQIATDAGAVAAGVHPSPRRACPEPRSLLQWPMPVASASQAVCDDGATSPAQSACGSPGEKPLATTVTPRGGHGSFAADRALASAHRPAKLRRWRRRTRHPGAGQFAVSAPWLTQWTAIERA